jgi:perosamine synthetase
MTTRFEELSARYTGTKYAAAVSNGTCGLHMCVIAAGIQEGDEVITSPFSFVASANCVLYERATPVFADIDPLTLNIDPNRIEAAITKHTKAILPVHAFGQPADMTAIIEIAKRHNLVVIEDACEALGAEWREQKAGTFGDAAVFAYYPNKQMTTGEGGMVVTNREDWRDLFRSLRNQGRDVFDSWLNHSRLGYNYRIDEMSAALGVAQMERIDTLLNKRETVARCYEKHLKNIEGVTVPYVHPDTTRMSWFVYVVRLNPKIDRTKVMTMLNERGVPTRPYFSSIHLQKFYREQFGYQPGTFPITETVEKETMALPFHSNLSEEDVRYVCEQLKEILPHCR